MRDPTLPITTYRDFVDRLQGLCEHLTNLVTGDKSFVPMVHYLIERHPHSVLLADGWLNDDEGKRALVHNLVIPTAVEMGARAVAWTWVGVTEARSVEPPHEAAMVVAIDREVHEVHEARLVRHDDRASLGAWRPWPPNQNAGLFVTPIQEALR